MKSSKEEIIPYIKASLLQIKNKLEFTIIDPFAEENGSSDFFKTDEDYNT